MKHIYLLSLALLPLTIFAQNKIGYSYDAAGNRVKREVILTSARRQASSSNKSEIYSDKILAHSVTIAPNPTEGALKVSVGGLNVNDKCSLGVYSVQGAQILTKEVKENSVDIDIANQPAGIYMLRITINNSSSTWKIVKK